MLIELLAPLAAAIVPSAAYHQIRRFGCTVLPYRGRVIWLDRNYEGWRWRTSRGAFGLRQGPYTRYKSAEYAAEYAREEIDRLVDARNETIVARVRADGPRKAEAPARDPRTMDRHAFLGVDVDVLSGLSGVTDDMLWHWYRSPLSVWRWDPDRARELEPQILAAHAGEQRLIAGGRALWINDGNVKSHPAGPDDVANARRSIIATTGPPPTRVRRPKCETCGDTGVFYVAASSTRVSPCPTRVSPCPTCGKRCPV